MYTGYIFVKAVEKKAVKDGLQTITKINNNFVDNRNQFLKLVRERRKWRSQIKSPSSPSEFLSVDESDLPINDDMPGAYLAYAEPAPVNKTYCKLNFKLPYDLAPKRKITPGGNKSSRYRVQYNAVEAHNITDVPQITYATHATADFAYYIPELLKRWDGLISIGAFVPDLDVSLFLEQIVQYCYCEPEMHRVSIHLIHDLRLPASTKDIYFLRPETCRIEDSSQYRIYSNFDDSTIYPINVCRNAARKASLTKYVLVSDIQLMPSKDLASGFLDMLTTNQLINATKKVYVLPIFELAENEYIPDTKADLIDMIADNRSVYFHKFICKHCQNFPGLEQWIADSNTTNVKEFSTIKRQDPHHRWEPIFIGTNAEPWYNEELSWEGLQDKMLHTIEMCLMDYDFTILDNAFLVHWPGIRTDKLAVEEWRLPYIRSNELVYKRSIQLLQKNYRNIEGCRVNASMNLFYKKKTKPTSVNS
ncbi:hypothetical protein GWI33_021487 [Rhynchophorus ferrugineus]|uniref:N-acetyllactosaminide beta-1,3-N-acetylglucosaminyltransferase n=1 Tax=Rhynchophorus ferrugineus TaxID=354439 RepID=A0A834IPA3_RHYFE|nr:hypothetical protein GWI33_021487 [Rhynchophorus ferrugineus]